MKGPPKVRPGRNKKVDENMFHFDEDDPGYYFLYKMPPLEIPKDDGM